MRQSSADSSGGAEMEYCGKLHFALRYDKDVEGLIVKVRGFVAAQTRVGNALDSCLIKFDLHV